LGIGQVSVGRADSRSAAKVGWLPFGTDTRSADVQLYQREGTSKTRVEYEETCNLSMAAMDGISAAGQALVVQYLKDKKSCVLNKRRFVSAHIALVTSTHAKMEEQVDCSAAAPNSAAMIVAHSKCMYSIASCVFPGHFPEACSTLQLGYPAEYF
jgi:hypothetical protein